MKTIKLFAAITCIVAVCCLLLPSCRKGDTGPAGASGADGKDGVANIQTTTVTTTNISWGALDLKDNSYNANLSVSAITQAVVERGTVQVFISGDATGTKWMALPFSQGLVQYNYSYKSGFATINVAQSNGGTPNNPGGQTFKIVVIPPAS